MVSQPNKKPVEFYESVYSVTFAESVNGKREVKTPVGLIDVLTDLEVIEIKRVKQWKSAVGQIILYGAYYPEKGKRIHLLGLCPADQKELIEIACNKVGVRVTWDGRPKVNRKSTNPILKDQVLEFIKINRNERFTPQDVQLAIGASNSDTVRVCLNRLAKKGLINTERRVKLQRTGGTRYHVYFLD